jgi:ADP-heptose:LPS heptosyltransferase
MQNVERGTRPRGEIDWTKVERVLIVRLRSIGDTVLCTPALLALRRFLPHAQIDILLEDWVTPLLDGFDAVDNVLTVGKGELARLRTALAIRRRKYDVVFNLHGGTTGTFFTVASGARHTIGFSYYQYSFLYSHTYPSGETFWKNEHVHSAEQQLALLGYTNVPVADRPRSRLPVTAEALRSIDDRLERADPLISSSPVALIHPAAAFDTKQWATEKFARLTEFLAGRGIHSIAIAAADERPILDGLQAQAKVPVTVFDDLTLPEITALASRASIFIGNDSGIAHIAAAVNTPSVVIFGSSNIDNWRPWTDAPNQVVFQKLSCQPCEGYSCKQFDEPRCILSVTTESVFDAVDEILDAKKDRRAVSDSPAL